MAGILAAACAYFVMAFAAGFALGILRTLWAEPFLGRLGAVALEAPFMIAICWLAAGLALRRFAPAAGGAERAAVGALWLVLLLAAEFGVGLWLRGLAPGQVLALWLAPAGFAGLAIQVICATFPLLRRSATG